MTVPTTNGSSNGVKKPYRVIDQPHSKRAPFKIICVGAGASGLYLAHRVQQRMKDTELIIYEKNSDVGGTWLENQYPGCACDVPAHIYTYSFRPNPKFKSYYAGNEEIEEYFKEFELEYKLGRYIRFNTAVTSAVWKDDSGTYDVTVQDKDGNTKQDWCHCLINCSGVLNNWKWPEIDGLHDFQGTLAHSAAWDKSIDCTGKKVGIIGIGSSGIQITPQMQKIASSVEVFFRSPVWITPQLGGLGDPSRSPVPDNQPLVTDILTRGQQPFQFTEEEQELLRNDPELLLTLRRCMEVVICSNMEAFKSNSAQQAALRKFVTEDMASKLGDNEELKSKIIPKFGVGCRRPTPGAGFLEALVSPNVTPVYSPIEKFTSTGIKTQDGKQHDFDVIICATGFQIGFVPFFELKGKGGARLQDVWSEEATCYLGIAAPGFPNYFTPLGPRGPWGNGTVLTALELNIDYFITMMIKMQSQGIKSCQPSLKATEEFSEHADEWHSDSVWNENCRSWYKRKGANSKPYLWCGTTPSYLKTQSTVRFEDFDYEYKHGNRFAYLGNGLVAADYLPAKEKPEKLVPYLRTSETPWEIE